MTAPAAAQGATGTVTFSDTTTSTLLGSATVVNGKATLSTTAITTPGAHSISAVYSGDANYNGVTPAAVTVTVTTTATTTTVLIAPAASVGPSITLTATVTPAPTGTASLAFFYDGGVLLGSNTVSVTTGKATLAVTNFTAGTITLRPTTPVTAPSRQQRFAGSDRGQERNNPRALRNGNSTYGQIFLPGRHRPRQPDEPLRLLALRVWSASMRRVTPANLLGSAAPGFGVGGETYNATFGTSTLTGGTHNIWPLTQAMRTIWPPSQ